MSARHKRTVGRRGEGSSFYNVERGAQSVGLCQACSYNASTLNQTFFKLAQPFVYLGKLFFKQCTLRSLTIVVPLILLRFLMTQAFNRLTSLATLPLLLFQRGSKVEEGRFLVR